MSTRYDLTTPEGLEAAVNAHGSWAALSRAAGVASSTLRDRALRFDIPTPGRPSARTGTTAGPAPEREKPDAVLEREVKSLRSQIKKLTEGETDQEAIIRRLESAIADAEPLFTPTIFRPTADGDRTAQEMVLLLSDLHASEVVSLEETRGMNQYNWPLMLERLDDVRQAILSHKEHFGFAISKLRIFMLGDMLSGDIHEELAITNDRPAAEAVVQLAYDLTEWVRALAPEFPEVVIEGVPGNHPRATRKPQAKMAHNNGDWLLYQMIGMLNPEIPVSAPRGSYNIAMICDRYRALLMHGDGIRSTMPGVPWAGVSRRVTTLEQQFSAARQPIDYVFLGHYHTTNQIDGVQARTWMNGSLKGLDEYSLKQFGSGRPAAQSLLTFHPKRGYTGSYAIELQTRQAASEGWLK